MNIKKNIKYAYKLYKDDKEYNKNRNIIKNVSITKIIIQSFLLFIIISTILGIFSFFINKFAENYNYIIIIIAIILFTIWLIDLISSIILHIKNKKNRKVEINNDKKNRT